MEELREVGLRLGVGLAFAPRRAVGSHHVPARAARGEGVGRHHLHARLDEIRPVRDVLGVPLAHDDHDDRVGHEAVCRVLVPASRHEPRLDQPFDVGGEREVDHVGVQAADDGAALFARAPIGLLEAHALARRRRLEGGDQLFEDPLRGRVGDQREALGRTRSGRTARGQAKARGAQHQHSCKRASVHIPNSDR